MNLPFLRNRASARANRTQSIESELQFHLETETESNVALGMSPEEARRTAHSRLGNAALIREEVYWMSRPRFLEDLKRDIVYALRTFGRDPAVTVAAVLSLALGLGAAITVFSVAYGTLVNSFPYKDPGRLFYLVLTEKDGHEFWPDLTNSEIERLRKIDRINSVSASWNANLAITGEDVPEDVTAVYLTPNSSTQLGVPALFGRALIESDAPVGQEPQPVVVLSYKFWKSHEAGRTNILGDTLRLAHKTYTIVGVMPPRFRWRNGDVYLPLNFNDPQGWAYNSLLKLKEGVSEVAANAELQSLIVQFANERPAHYPAGFKVRIQRVNEWVVRSAGSTLALLFAAVNSMLLIGCANVSILLLARGISRNPELAIRAALGSSRGRILRLLLLDSLALSLCGVCGGILIASQAVRLIAQWLPESSFPKEAAIGIDFPVLLFGSLLALLAGIISGVWPAFRLSRPDLRGLIQSGVAAGSRPENKRVHSILIAAQVTLTLLLLTGSGAASAAVFRLMHIDLGYDPDNTISVRIPVHENTHVKWEERSQYFNQIRETIARLPGVVSAAISVNATPPANGYDMPFQIFGKSDVEERQARINLVSSEYFGLLRIPLVKGRLWTGVETGNAASVAILNRTAALRFWPAGDVIGQQVRIPALNEDMAYAAAAPTSNGWLRIIGVVADAENDGLINPVKPAIYVPYVMRLPMNTQILVRTQGKPLSMLKTIRRAVSTVNPGQQIVGNPADLRQWISSQPEWGRVRLIAALLDGFSLLGLALSASGIYSVVAHSSTRRVSEFGLRMAVGAQRGDILVLVFRSTAKSLGAGLASGAALSLILPRAVAIWPSETPSSRLLLPGLVLLVIAVAGVASWLPARRASALNPSTALRHG